MNSTQNVILTNILLLRLIQNINIIICRILEEDESKMGQCHQLFTDFRKEVSYFTTFSQKIRYGCVSWLPVHLILPIICVIFDRYSVSEVGSNPIFR